MKYYTYINTSESELINWSWVDQSLESIFTRKSVNGDKLLISFNLEYCDEFERFNGRLEVKVQLEQKREVFLRKEK